MVKHKKGISKSVAAIIIVVTLCGTFVTTMFIKPDLFSIVYNTVNNIIYQGNNQTQDNGNNNNKNTDQPYIGTWIHLDNPVDECNRGDKVTFGITSNFKNVNVQFQAHYVGFGNWLTVGTYMLNNVGSLNLQLQNDAAGDWQIRVVHVSSSIMSNIETLTVEGLTIYQTKNIWNATAMETYTAQLTGSYDNWVVAIIYRDPANPNWWVLHMIQNTNAIGMIPYGTMNANLNPAMVGLTRDWKAIIAPTNSGFPLSEWLTQHEAEGCFSDSDINSAVNSGQLVESNVLRIVLV